MHKAFQLAPGPIYQPEKPIRNPLYKRWLKGFPCVGCGRTWGIDPAHSGPHGLGIKSSDLGCLPLCRHRCHCEFDANPQAFAEKHKLDIPSLIQMFNRLWELKQRRTA